MSPGTSSTSLDVNTRTITRGYQGADPGRPGLTAVQRPAVCVTTSANSYIHGSGRSKSSAPLKTSASGSTTPT